MALELHYGGAVSGNQRFRRAELEARLHRTMQTSNGIKMFGLRRIGKSTLRDCAIEQFEAEKTPYSFFNGEGLNSLSDFMVRWLDAMPNRQGFLDKALGLVGKTPAKDVLEALSKGTPFEETTLDTYWQTVSGVISQTSSKEKLPVLIVDEFSMFMENLVRKHGSEKADRLLASMREWRGNGVKMLLTGSIGMKRLSREHGLKQDHLNDLQPFNIPELTDDEARDFIRQATDAKTWTDAHTEELLKQSGVSYPCFLVKGLLEVGTSPPPAPEDFARIFAERVRPHLHSDFFHQFDRRFKAYASLAENQRETLILPALRIVMSADGPCPGEQLPADDPLELKEAMEMLVEDGFLDFTEDENYERHWKPASRLAKNWWKRSGLA